MTVTAGEQIEIQSVNDAIKVEIALIPELLAAAKIACDGVEIQPIYDTIKVGVASERITQQQRRIINRLPRKCRDMEGARFRNANRHVVVSVGRGGRTVDAQAIPGARSIAAHQLRLHTGKWVRGRVIDDIRTTDVDRAIVCD